MTRFFRAERVVTFSQIPLQLLLILALGIITHYLHTLFNTLYLLLITQILVIKFVNSSIFIKLLV